MKRKVAKVGTVRLSPNEEALILKQERERRRKVRLQQVREQEKFIAQQFRQGVKERRDQQLQQLAEELRAKWEAAQAEKIQALENVYLSTLNAIGEGHRQAKENEPDLEAIEKTAAVNKEKAERRHREALRELKQHRERELRDQTWHLKARRKALVIEKERAAVIASLPPPPPDPLENIEIAKRLPLVKLCNVDSFSVSHYHLAEPYVDREIITEQPDARAAAVEEGKRLDALQKEEERERMEQMEKALLRGSHALKMVHLTQDRERLMKELDQMQQEDLARRRQVVAQMPQQLFEPAYRRAEIREEWQKELESAFEDMYTRDTKMRGDMVLQLKPQPLPDPSVTSVDEDLNLSVEPEAALHSGETEEVSTVDELPGEVREPQSRLALKKLLNRIRTQKDQWSVKSVAETVSDTLESGSLPVDKEPVDGLYEEENKPESKDVTDNTVLAGKSLLLHPNEQAMLLRVEAERKNKVEDLERQKQEQLELLRKLEEERKSLEEEYYKVRLQVKTTSKLQTEPETHEAAHEERPEPVESVALTPERNTSAENLHLQLIREYQQRLIQQNRQHKQSVDDARTRLQEYQLLLKKRYPHLSTSGPGIPDDNHQTAKSHGTAILDAGFPKATLSSPGGNGVVPLHAANETASEQPSTRNDGTLQERAATAASPCKEFLVQEHVESEGPAATDTSPVRFSSSDSLSSETIPPVAISHTGTQYQSPNEDQTRAQHRSEKLSSTSSPGDCDMSSDSYHPLPPALSLGLPPDDFPEPSIPLTIPGIQATKKNYLPLGDFSNIHEFRERLLSSTAGIRTQQGQLKEMQDYVDKQRESLLSKQRLQEEQLLQKQKELEDEMRRHQESLENLLSSREPKQRAVPTDLCQIPKSERYSFMSSLLKELDDNQEDFSSNELSNSGLIRVPLREHRWRPSKPPVTKTKLGPFLEQHELSAILEVETPTSGRRSSTGLAEPLASHPVPIGGPAAEEPVHYIPDMSKTGIDSLYGDLEFSRLSTSSKDQSCNESSNRGRSKLSWRETLSLEASLNLTNGGHTQFPSAHTDLTGFLTNNQSLFLKHPVMPESSALQEEAAHGRSPDTNGDALSTTTISTGSFLTSEKAESSPANSEALSDLQRCNYSVIGEAQDTHSSPSAPSTMIRPAVTWSNYISPVEERSHIRQIIEKYTKDLSASLERNLSFHTPEAAIDTSTDNHFHPLDPKPDFSISTPSYVSSNTSNRSRYTGELSQSSSHTSNQEPVLRKSPLSYLSHDSPIMSSSFGFLHSRSVDFMRGLPRKQSEAIDSSGSFLPLHPESTLNEPNMSSHMETSFKQPTHGLDNVQSTQPLPPPSQGYFHDRDATSSHSALPNSSEILSGPSIVEESGSFHELIATQVTINDSDLSEHPISSSVLKRSKQSVHFAELPAVPKEQSGEEDNPNTDYHKVADHDQQQLLVLHEDSSRSSTETSDHTLKTESLTSHSGSSINYLSSLTIGSSANSLLSCGHTWDSGSARGILEEPELTLMSLNDSSIVCSEPGHTLTSVSDQHESGNISQNRFHPLPAEVDASAVTGPDQSSVGMSSSQNFVEIDPAFTSTPGNLQEAFLKKKKLFIEKSSQRVQEIKNKERVSKNVDVPPQLSANPDHQGEPQHPSSDTSPSEVGQLKKVVEVRVCTPEDRKLSEIEMQQRTIRLYNRLDEVKTRKEEKMRQETYARNREKAKAFKKRTLEKLRANKMK